MYDSNDVKRIFGKNIRNLRITNGLTQEELAEIVGLERKSITAIETGVSYTSSDILAKLSNYFNVELSFFYKTDYIEQTNVEINIKKEINRLLFDCKQDLLEKIYNIIITLKK